MKLVIDGGSSHSKWVVIGDEVLENKSLSGINPVAMPESISTIIDFESPYKDQISDIYYYGSGVSNQKAEDMIRMAFAKSFSQVKTTLQSDIIAACLSTSCDKTSIVSILGTGVNTVLYDGNNIAQAIKSLGYIIEEEGSGFNIGRLIVKRFLRSSMSPADNNLFREKYLSKNEDLIHLIYTHKRPNYYIASMTEFLNECSEPLKEEILKENFDAYTLNHIKKIDNYRDYKVNFVGSIAYVFKEHLLKSMYAIDAEIGQIIKNPTNGLIEYHLKN